MQHATFFGTSQSLCSIQVQQELRQKASDLSQAEAAARKAADRAKDAEAEIGTLEERVSDLEQQLVDAKAYRAALSLAEKELNSLRDIEAERTASINETETELEGLKSLRRKDESEINRLTAALKVHVRDTPIIFAQGCLTLVHKRLPLFLIVLA